MKECEYYQQLVSRLLDGDLTADEDAELREHIRRCPDCRRMYDVFSQIGGAMRGDGMLQPPAALAPGVMDRIAAHSRPAPVPAPATHRLRSWKKLAAAACFVALVAAGAVTGVFGRGQRLAADSADYNAAQDAGALAVPPQVRTVSDAGNTDTASASRSAEPAPASALSGGADTLPAEDGASVGVPEPVKELPETVTAETAVEEPLAADVEEETAKTAAEPDPREAAADTAADTSADMADSAAPATAEDSGIMLAMGAQPDAAADSALALAVTDRDGQTAGYITDTAALEALLTGEALEAPLPEAVYSAPLHGTACFFAADESGGLLWWREGDTAPTLSPAALADLEELITSTAP